ncbi:hypothetical protein INT45_001802 [Circinella minor]|uniref:F-box domain-containing protein n=1 Tax=Circinella minor TaxID=1195481 RepID=A0A8H7RVN1_9FUNG|nr:hypothetical protein INT45_001802 [Circinella minor]
MAFPELPSEIWHSIFSKLTFRDCIRCTGVNHNLRSAVFGWDGLWHEISNEQGHAVQRFRLNTHSDQQLLLSDKVVNAMATVNFLIEYNCNNIKEGVLVIDFWPTSILYKISSICHHSLTRLDLLCIDKLTMDTYMIPTLVLRHLPHLITFAYRAVVTQIDEFVDDEPWCLFEPPINLIHRNLTELVIEMFGNGRPISMHLLLRLLPKLQRVSLNALDCSNANATMHTLLHHCHDIEIVEIHDGQDDNFRWDNILSRQLQQEQKRGEKSLDDVGNSDRLYTIISGGLQYLVVDGDERFLNVNTLQPIITKYQHTLRMLRIRGYEPITRLLLSQQCISHLTFSQLHSLILVNLDQPPPEMLSTLSENFCTFLRQTKGALENINLSVADLMNDTVLDCLAHQELECLTYLRLAKSSVLSDTGFIRFLQYPGIGKQLKSLDLNEMDLLTGKILHTVAERLTSVEKLTITGCKRIGIGELQLFFSRIHLLKWLHLVCFIETEECPQQMIDYIVEQLKNKAIEWKFVLKTNSNDNHPPSVYRVFTSDGV